MKTPFERSAEAPTDEKTEETQANDKISYPLLRQLVENRFLAVVVRRTATPEGIKERPIFSMVNQSGRGKEKMVLEISFCPITGANLSDVDFSKLNTDTQITF